MLNPKYEMVIGLETHAELSTESKIFCACKNEFGSEVNTNCCPVCMGMPGSLPQLNKMAVEYAIMMGHALNCEINLASKMDRKNYFYPDLPKSYQVSQVETPICGKGHIDLYVNGETKRIGINQLHIEEDTAKLIHEDDATLIDFNRAMVPLIEIVSAPDFRSLDEVEAYLDNIKAILEYLDISDAKMQEGSIRCDVNVSINEVGATEFGARVEVKNVNTFSGALRAIEYEVARHTEILENGGEVPSETRRWDDMKGETIPMRGKEENDYLVFTDPDFLPIVLEKSYVDELKTRIPTLPNERVIKYVTEYSIPESEAAVLSHSKSRSDFFEECVAMGNATPKSLANWVLGDISKIINDGKFTLADISPQSIVEMVQNIESGKVSNTAGKTVLDELFTTDKSVDQIISDKGLAQLNDTSALEQIVADVLAANPKTIEDYKSGKTNVLGFLVGQCMKASRGTGNPQILNDMIKGILDN